MKITLAIPKGKDIKSRMKKELSLAKNIKDSGDRNSIIEGLNKIINIMEDGKVYLYDGDTKEFFIYDYPLKEFIYYCGKDFNITSDIDTYINSNKYLLVAMDADHCTIGLLRNKSIVKLWDEDSNVPRKHDAGGQSQRRFERAREEALK